MSIKPVEIDEVTRKVRIILGEILNIDPEEIKPESKIIDDLGIDSIDYLTIVSKFETELNVKISILQIFNKSREVLNSVVNNTDEIIQTLESIIDIQFNDKQKGKITSLLNGKEKIYVNDTNDLITEILTVDLLIDIIYQYASREI